MSDKKGSIIAKSVSKQALRAKEKILQNLGKVDKTADDVFDEHLDNFNRQQRAAARLQKEFTNYIRCVRATQAASKALQECVAEVYESGWTGQDLLFMQTQNLEMLWQDYTHKLADQVLLPLNTYCAQFSETRKKIDKRNRKMVDYDSYRHTLISLESAGNKKRDESKIAKAREDLIQAKRTYDTLNSDLRDELPSLYQSRIPFLVNNLQTMFAVEQQYHADTSKSYSEMETIVDKLANPGSQKAARPDTSTLRTSKGEDKLPPGVLYRVKATYKYNREDVDELSFDVNEIIQVVAFDDPEEQEEGWLMGIKESTNEKGVFPANFTRPI